MRIQLLSDLHWDSDPDFRPVPLAGADLLVLAGDVAGRFFSDGCYGLRHFSADMGWPTPVLYVPGNHEYDGGDFDRTHAQLRDICERLGIVWLEGRTCVIGGVRWTGSTMWADFDALVEPQADAFRKRQLRAKAMRAANFYMPRMQITRGGRPFLARQMRTLALQAHQWLSGQLQQPWNGPSVVVSHFAPSLHSADPRYGKVTGTAGFCNNWDGLVAQADYWLHGHVHCHQNYQLRGCRVMANPVGYPKPQERDGFRRDWLIEISGGEPLSTIDSGH